MDIQILWCKHCGSRYNHQFSGEGCFDNKSSDTHCEECNTAIKNALSTISKKVEERFMDCPEYGDAFKTMVEEQFQWEKQTRTFRLLIRGKWYISFKVDNPNSFNKMTVYCCENEIVLVKGKFRISDNYLLGII